MEDDGKFNAGSGSILRLDGKTIEMDASVMDSTGRLGMVIGVRDVKNPVLLARAVTETPHVAFSGEGAMRFARQHGFGPFHHVSPKAQARYDKLHRLVKDGKVRTQDKRWKDVDVRTLWNFDVPYENVFAPDTVGAVVMDREGRLAVAASTGGASPMLLGRVGDTALIGCGFYADGVAAVAATGIGEEIIRKMLAKSVHDAIQAGKDVKAACEEGVAHFPYAFPTGIIAISASGYAIVANRQMAACSLVKET